MKKFEGVYPPHITPFDSKEDVDEEGLRELVDFWIEEGVHGLIPGGSTGEGISLLHEERKKVFDIVIDQANGRVPVVPATGCNSTKETILLSKYAEDAGADGVMVVHPFYSVMDEHELYEHYREVSRAVNIPIMLYNNPFTSGKDAKPELIAKLAEENVISYVKESSLILQRVPEILRLSRGKVTVHIGADSIMFEAFMLGARGWISAMANFIPRLAVQLFELSVWKKNLEEAKKIDDRIRPIGVLMGAHGKYVQYSKYGVELIGKPAGPTRRPLLPLMEKEKAEFRKLLSDAGVL